MDLDALPVLVRAHNRSCCPPVHILLPLRTQGCSSKHLQENVSRRTRLAGAPGEMELLEREHPWKQPSDTGRWELVKKYPQLSPPAGGISLECLEYHPRVFPPERVG